MRPAIAAPGAALGAALGAAFAAALAVAPVASGAQVARTPDIARTQDIRVKNAWIPLPPKGLTSAAAYMDIVNSGPQTDRLLGAACSCAARAELHEMSVAGGVMRMRPTQGGLEIRPTGEARLAPHGEHLMLMGLKQPLHVGEPVPLTLQFQHAGKVTVEALVKAPPFGGME
jgi:periplasmic copper chaperone A